MNIYPWQISQWQRLRQANETDRFPHGILLTGPSGIGLAHFAHCLAAALLCDAFAEESAEENDSRNWQLFSSGNHPDYVLLEPEATGKQIKVDQIRDLIEFLQLTSQYGKKKVAVLNPADNLNRNAANSLLKTLEEPPENSLIILISHRPTSLPITIRSRCQTIHFEKQNDVATRQWLENKTGDGQDIKQILDLAESPLAALAMLEDDEIENRRQLLEDLIILKNRKEDPLEIASKWNTLGADKVVISLQRFFVDMLRLKISQRPPRLQNTDLTENLHQIIKRLDLFQLLACYEFLGRTKSQLNSSISFNTQGLLEEFIIHWQAIEPLSGGKSK